MGTRRRGSLSAALFAVSILASAVSEAPAQTVTDPAADPASVSIRVDTAAYDRPEVVRILRSLLYAPTLEFLDLPAGALRGMRPCFLFSAEAPRPLRAPEQLAQQIRRLGGQPVAIPHGERFAAAQRGLCDLVRIGFADDAQATRPPQPAPRPAPGIRPLPQPVQPLQPRPAPDDAPRSPPPEREPEPRGAAPRVSLDGYRDDQVVEVGDAPTRFLVRIVADATLTAVEVAYPGGGFVVGRQQLLRQTRFERFFAVPALSPGERGTVVAEAADSRGRVGRIRVGLVGAPAAPVLRLRQPDGEPYRDGADIVAQADPFALAYEAEADAGLEEIRFQSGGWVSANRFPRGLEMQRTDGRMEIPAPDPGQSVTLSAVAVDRRGRQATVRLVLSRPAPVPAPVPAPGPPATPGADERRPDWEPPLPRARPERRADPALPAPVPRPETTPLAPQRPPRADPPEPANRPPRIDTEDVVEARTWLAGGDGTAVLEGAAFDDDGRVVRVRIESGGETWVEGARFSRPFAMPACSRQRVTITAWDDEGLSTSRTVDLRSGHWLGAWVCRAGFPPALATWGVVLAAVLLALLALRRLSRPRRQRLPVVVRWRAAPDPAGTASVIAGPALTVTWRIGEGPASDARVAPRAEGADR